MPQQQTEPKAKPKAPPEGVDAPVDPSTDPATDMVGHSIKGVEVFSAGTWNGDSYTVEDLDLMVKAFEENKDHVRPFLKLGHDEEQKLLQQDGLPAAGWVERIYRKGEKLMADFTDIPAKIYELIKRKAYRKVSCEIYMNCQIEERKYSFFVGAIALLGADTPGVMNLDDILAHYRLLAEESKKLYASQRESSTIKTYSIEGFKPTQEKKQMSKTERELELEAKVAALEAEKKTTDEKITTLDTEAKKFAAEKKELAEKLAQTEIEKAVEGLVGEKLITPAMKPYVAALLGNERADYSVGDKQMKKNELVKELLKLFQAAAKVNLTESSSDGADTSESKDKGQDAVMAEVKEYAEKHKVAFSAAYRAVAKKHEEALAAPRLIEQE